MADTTMTIEEFFVKMEERLDAVTAAQKSLNDLYLQAIEELGRTFEYEGQYYMIRNRKGKAYLCEYEKAPGAHFSEAAAARKTKESNVIHLNEDGDKLVEFEIEVGPDLLDDPDYGLPDIVPSISVV